MHVVIQYEIRKKKILYVNYVTIQLMSTKFGLLYILFIQTSILRGWIRRVSRQTSFDLNTSISVKMKFSVLVTNETNCVPGDIGKLN